MNLKSIKKLLQRIPAVHVRNIRYYYLFTFLYYLLLFSGNWLFLFNQYLTPLEIATANVIGFVVGFLFEIPSGAFADIFGKKKSLIISLLLLIISVPIYLIDITFTSFLIAEIIVFISFAFLSGADDSFVYDSLEEKNKISLLDAVLSFNTNLLIVSSVLGGIIGGILFSLNPRLPFIINFFIYLIALLIVIKGFREPAVDTTKFSFSKYKQQITRGFKLLAKSNFIHISILLVTILGLFAAYSYALIRPSMGEYFGYGGATFSFLTAASSLVVISLIYLFNKLKQKIGGLKILYLMSFMTFTAYLVSVLTKNILLGGIIILILNFSGRYIKVLIPSITKNIADSSNRSTLISTISLLGSLFVISLNLLAGQLGNVGDFRILFIVFAGIILSSILISLFLKMKESR